jgi:hypothetical protein
MTKSNETSSHQTTSSTSLWSRDRFWAGFRRGILACFVLSALFCCGLALMTLGQGDLPGRLLVAASGAVAWFGVLIAGLGVCTLLFALPLKKVRVLASTCAGLIVAAISLALLGWMACGAIFVDAVGSY